MIIKQKLLSLWSKKLPLFQMICFILGKICFLMVQLPRYEKQSTIIIELVFSSLFYTLAISFKILQHKSSIVNKLPKMMIQSFLGWIVGLLVMMFTFALEDKLKYVFIQKMLSMLVIVLEITNLVLLCNAQFITKREFIFFQCVLGINAIALAEKCIWFLTYEDDDSKIKDILLLNLTTHIALVIIFMQSISQSFKEYRKSKIVEMTEDTARVEQQLVMTN